MKKILSILLIFLLILCACGCAKTDTDDDAFLLPKEKAVLDVKPSEPEYKKPSPPSMPTQPEIKEIVNPEPPITEPPITEPPKPEPPKTYPEVADYVNVPVLMYHHISPSGEGAYTVSIENFKAHLDFIAQNGYNTISLSQLSGYAQNGEALPQNPIIITFDDGYLSNYEIAFPLLKERGMKAVIFAIGSSIGTFNGDGSDTDSRINYSQIIEMSHSGIETQSHTFNMHRAPISDTDPTRKGVGKLYNETDEEHLFALQDDFALFSSTLKDRAGQDVFALSYPYGIYNENSEAAADASGIKMTFTSESGVSTIKKNDVSSLRLIKRFEIDDCTTQQLLEKIKTV